jgi:uncharacterized phiE125 gp8 family phage protein
MTTINLCALTCAQWDALLTTYNVRVITAPLFADEPITLEEAWHHLRIDTFSDGNSPPETVSGDDVWLEQIGIPAARNWAEGYVGKSLVTQTLELVGNAFPSTYFELPFGPVQNIDSIIYIDADDVEQTMDPADYVLNSDVWPARCQLEFGVDAWPTARDSWNSVRVRYVAGYTPANDSPAGFVISPALKIGILLMLGHLYENREDSTSFHVEQIPNGARTFLDKDRVRRGWA